MDILEKIDMITTPTHLHKDMIALLELGMFLDEDINVINESEDASSFTGKVTSLAHKLGLHIGIDKRGGLIGMLMKSSKVMGELIWNAMKATTGDAKAKERVKELANTEIDKGEILDFLLRLDGVTLHAITGPIHLIDNLTGWHIWPAIRDKVVDVSVRAKKALDELIKVAKKADDTVKTKVKSLLQGLARVFGLDDEHKEIQTAF